MQRAGFALGSQRPPLKLGGRSGDRPPCFQLTMEAVDQFIVLRHARPSQSQGLYIVVERRANSRSRADIIDGGLTCCAHLRDMAVLSTALLRFDVHSRRTYVTDRSHERDGSVAHRDGIPCMSLTANS